MKAKTSLTQKSRKFFHTVHHSIFRKVLLPVIAVTGLSLAFYSCEDKSKETKAQHDPSKDIKITKFEPETGRIRDMVIVYGENFGSDAENIKVFFNHVEAKVVGASKNGDQFMVLVPRLPGDECVISVRVGGTPTPDGLNYTGGKTATTEHLGFFNYLIAANITTIAGNGEGRSEGNNATDERLNEGLDQAQFWPLYLAIDSEDNIFVSLYTSKIVRMNVAENSIIVIANAANDLFQYNCTPAVHPYTDVIMYGARNNNPRDRFLFLDPKDGWAPKSKYIKTWNSRPEEEPPTYTNTVTGVVERYADFTTPGPANYHHWCLWSPYPERDIDAGKAEEEKTGWYYTRYDETGHIVRVDPLSWDATVIGMTATGIAYSAAVHPLRPWEIWIGAGSEGNAGNGLVLGTNVPGSWSNSICVMDVRDCSFEPVINEASGLQTRGLMSSARKISSTVVRGSHRDGKIQDAEFNRIRQVGFDPDGNLYVGDCNNRCLRMIATMADPMMVSTVIGIPGKEGFKDGNPEEALFRQLHGIVTDKEGIVYITDWDNGRLRRVAIE